ncbi:unnamed protein product [Peronospora farinosa]|uniref:Uncharacterized protein n=1 Tax=Peronospora farinosa TaxID=134698 RepID=A0AAV0SQJ7_9STRA|nr:unnamed protein product [Peronospora farinosa]
MMQPFVIIADGSKDLKDGDGVDRYRSDIKNSLQFNLAVGYLAAGCTFRQSSHILLSTKDLTRLASIRCSSDATVAKYARFDVVINLQKIVELLKQSWTFSIALDMSTHMRTSYLAIRLL